MKKYLIIVLLFLTIPSLGFEYSSYCSSDNASKSLIGAISSVSGASMIARLVAQNEIEKALKKETSSKFKVKVNSFWGTNLTQGEFSRFYAKSKNFSYKHFNCQKLTLETICPYNKVSYENNKLNFDTDMVLKFNAELNEDNLSELFNQKLRIEDDRVVIDIKISAFGIKTSLKLYAGLEVTDNKIQLCNIKLNNQSVKLSKYAPLLNNLVNFKVDLDKNTKAKVKIDNIKIKNSLIYLTGYTFIPRS